MMDPIWEMRLLQCVGLYLDMSLLKPCNHHLMDYKKRLCLLSCSGSCKNLGCCCKQAKLRQSLSEIKGFLQEIG